MNKKLLVIVAAAVILVGGVFMLTSKKAESPSTDSTTSESTSSDSKSAGIDACSILTESIAKQVLGNDATKGTEPSGASSDDVAVSNCTYLSNGSKLTEIKGANVLVRTGLTNAGKESNKSQFGSGAPAGSQHVDGFGDDANFYPAFGQLNVLKNGNWYIVSNYTGTNPSKATLDEVKALATRLQFK